MSTKHTPGPWSVARGDWAESGNVRYELDGMIVLRKADVKLIEAAPELLAALKTAAEVIGHPDDSFSMYMARLIAKATGESA
jgi:hypothetical protein